MAVPSSVITSAGATINTSSSASPVAARVANHWRREAGRDSVNSTPRLLLENMLLVPSNAANNAPIVSAFCRNHSCHTKPRNVRDSSSASLSTLKSGSLGSRSTAPMRCTRGKLKTTPAADSTSNASPIQKRLRVSSQALYQSMSVLHGNGFEEDLFQRDG